MGRLLPQLSLTLLLLLQASCASQQSGSNLSGDLYHENLTLIRPNYDVEEVDTSAKDTNNKVRTQYVAPTHTVNAKVDMVLDSLDKLNQIKKFVDGFTVQIYSGPNREDALSAKAKMVKEMSDLEANIQYTQPKFRVTAGKYFTKLEAQKDLMRLRIFFPNAILVPEKIMIK